eukprot:scpid31650/ scgid5786/ 
MAASRLQRNTPHSATRHSPASVLFKQLPTTRLSLLTPSFAAEMQRVTDVDTSANRQFAAGDLVWVLNARQPRQPKWLEGIIVSRRGPLSYTISCSGMSRHVHIDFLRPRVDSADVDLPAVQDPPQRQPSFPSAPLSTPAPPVHVPPPEQPIIPPEPLPSPTLSPTPPAPMQSPVPTVPPVQSPVLRRSTRTSKPVERLNL